MTVNSWLLALILMSTWYFGYRFGRWWERVKDAPPPQDPDEMMW